MSHYQDWKNIVNKDILCNKQIITENNRLQIVRMNQSMYYDIYKNSQDGNNRKFVPDEVFNSLEETSEVVNQIINSYDNEEGPFVYAVLRRKDNANQGDIFFDRDDLRPLLQPYDKEHIEAGRNYCYTMTPGNDN